MIRMPSGMRKTAKHTDYCSVEHVTCPQTQRSSTAVVESACSSNPLRCWLLVGTGKTLSRAPIAAAILNETSGIAAGDFAGAGD
mgnify:FL=1